MIGWPGASLERRGATAAFELPFPRAITAVARQLPTRLTDVRAMSINASTPRITRDASKRQAELRERAGQNHERRARHGGDAFARQHQRQHHQDLLTSGMSMPAACATNTDASARYSVLPSRLNE